MDNSRAAAHVALLGRQVAPAPPPILRDTSEWSVGAGELVGGSAGLVIPPGRLNPLLCRSPRGRVRCVPPEADVGVHPSVYACLHAFARGPPAMLLGSSGLIPVDVRVPFGPALRYDSYQYQVLQGAGHGQARRLLWHPDVIVGKAAGFVRLDAEMLIEVVNRVVAGAAGSWHDAAVLQAALGEAPSKHWQGLLEAGDEACVGNTVRAVRSIVFDVMRGEFGQCLFQKLVSACCKAHLGRLVRVMAARGEELVAVAKNRHGVKCVRHLLLAVKGWKPILRELTTALATDVAGLMMGQSGFNIVRTCLNRLDAEQAAFIYEGAVENLTKLAKDQYGCLALIQCIEHAPAPTKGDLVDRIISSSACLSQDPYANYVVQHIAKLQGEDYTDRLCRELREHCLQLSVHRNGSHVVQKLIPSTGGRHLLEELVFCKKPEQLARDPYGSFVLQVALEILKGQPSWYTRLAKVLIEHAQGLRLHPIGKHVIKLLEKHHVQHVDLWRGGSRGSVFLTSLS